MKWLKRLLILVAIALVLAVGAAVGGVYMFHSAPSRYRAKPMTDAQIFAAANSANQKFAGLISWVAAIEARTVRLHRGTATSESDIGPQTISITEEEINSFGQKMSVRNRPDIQQKLSENFSDGHLVLTENQIVLVGESKEMGTLISVVLVPSIDDKGRFWLKLDAIDAGRLPVPRGMMDARLQKISASLEEKLPDYQRDAKVDAIGIANPKAMAAEMTRLLLNTIHDRPSDPVVFVPTEIGDWRHSLAVQITAIKVTDGLLTVTLAPMTQDDQSALLEKIQQPYQDQAAAAAQ